jgi:hypothetical protein
MHVQLSFPPDTDPNGESGADPAEGPSFELAIGPYVAVSYAGGAANARGALRGTVLPGSPKAPDPVVKTQVAVQQLGNKGGKCRWLSKGKIVSRRANHGACDQPVWQNAPMTFKPKSVLSYEFPLPKALPHGRYEAIGRATLKSGVTNHTYPVRIDRVTFRR